MDTMNSDYKTYTDLSNTTITTDSGKFFYNATVEYLAPSLNTYGSDFTNKFNKLNHIAWGIDDEKKPSKYTFDIYSNNFLALVKSNSDFKTLNYFQDNFKSYIYKDKEGCLDKIMLVIPLEIENRFAFLEGRYTELYDLTFIEKYIKKTKKISIQSRNSFKNIEVETFNYGVISNSDSSKSLFKQRVYDSFNTNILESDIKQSDFPPFLNMEIFNYQLPKK